MASLFFRRILCSRRPLLLSSATLPSTSSASYSRTRMPAGGKNESEVHYKVKEQVYRLNVPLNQAGQRRHKVTQTVAQIKFDVEEDETAVEETNAFNEATSISIDTVGTEQAAAEEEKEEQDGAAVATTSSTPNPTAKAGTGMRVVETRDVAVRVASVGSQERERGATTMRVTETEINYQQRSNLYTCRVAVPKSLVGLVVGKEQQKKRKLEEKTQSSIKVIRNKEEKRTEIFEISAPVLEAVERCKSGLESAIDEARKVSSPTHFISVPLEGIESLVEEYVQLVDAIQKEQDIPKECRQPKLFMPMQKIHLTLSVLRLFTKEDEERATKSLDEMMRNEIVTIISKTGGGSLEIKFPRLGFFGDKLENAKVLFADVECDRLVAIANLIDDTLYKAGLAEKRKEGDVKLHLTIGNLKYLRESRLRGLDFSKVMEKFGETSFHQVKPAEIRICSMSSVDPVTKSYSVLHSVKF